ncbi:hypothetical protein BIY26_14960 [Brenneria goodwinii]|uniref:Uncharacterized protein n=1 Tax=Brenneria goodwinii TaxID=1109412 RepID=A0AAE8EMJ0_9GAMM|nr:hypothetical protein [Brenneria goodwinii]ATA22823.1 hypothetical protein AWC36_01115 [Brenneria goodwinii]RLM20991.1 hypothetical protein BIY26_14960 [Brenneria goodwinii]
MKEIVLNEKNETVIYLISTILQGYFETIYNISENEPETAMNILLGEMLSEILYDFLIAYEVEECEREGIYKDVSDINVDEIKETILYWHNEHIIELVLKNIKQDDTDDPIYWKLKMTVNRR